MAEASKLTENEQRRQHLGGYLYGWTEFFYICIPVHSGGAQRGASEDNIARIHVAPSPGVTAVGVVLWQLSFGYDTTIVMSPMCMVFVLTIQAVVQPGTIVNDSKPILLRPPPYPGSVYCKIVGLTHWPNEPEHRPTVHADNFSCG